MRKPTDRYTNKNYSWLRAAIWKAYDCKDYYKGDVISFREMEIDHIISQEVFRDSVRLQQTLKEFGLPEGFQKDDLLNYVPTRRGTNTEKYKFGKREVIQYALSVASQRKEEIKRKIDYFFTEANIVDEAARIATNIPNESLRHDTIDIILHDTEEFPVEMTVVGNELNLGDAGHFVKSTGNIRLIGVLPNLKELTPSCTIEFRMLFLRGAIICIPGVEILKSLCIGNDTPLDVGIRKYLQKDIFGDFFYWVLGNCSFKLNRCETEELCEIIDAYAEAYIRALQKMEEENDLENFGLNKGSVRLFWIRQSLYDCIRYYINNNPLCYPDLKLNCNAVMLRVDSQNDRLHFMISVEEDCGFCKATDPKLWVSLHIYYSHDGGGINHEELWSPTRVRKWLLDILIPDAVKYFYEKKCKGNTDGNEKMDSLMVKSLESYMEDIEWSMETLNPKINSMITYDQELLNMVEKLQYHFASSSVPNYYSENRLKLYDTLLILLERTKLEGYSYKYISGNLGCLGLETKKEMIKFVKSKIHDQQEKKLYTTSEIELVLRCLAECIDRNSGELGFQTIRNVVMSLSDLIDFYNRNILINKYMQKC